MIAPASPSSDDPETLKALLAEAQAENERLRQIILAMQRHRFGRRAESLPEDQLLLGLEEAEQVLRDGQADLVSLVRAHIADPDLVRKTREGRVEDVRP